MINSKYLIIGEGRQNTMPNSVYKCLLKSKIDVDIIEVDKNHIFFKNWILNRLFLEINKIIDFFKPDKTHIKKILNIKPDIVIVFKGHKFNLSLIRDQLKNTKFINWHVDDPLNKKYIQQIGLENLQLYNMHVSSRSHKFSEYKKLGFKNLVAIDFAADSEIFNIDSANKFFISFVGNYSPHRQKIIREISKKFKIDVWGSGWIKNYKHINKNVNLNGFSHFKKYIKITKLSTYCLNILTPENSDKSNLRVFELLALDANQIVIGDLDKKLINEYKINSFKSVANAINFIDKDFNEKKYYREIFFDNRVNELLKHINEIWGNYTV